MPQSSEHAGPVVRTLRGFDADQTGSLVPEELCNLGAPKPLTQDCFTSTIYPVDLKHILGNIQPNHFRLDGHEPSCLDSSKLLVVGPGPSHQVRSLRNSDRNLRNPQLPSK